MTIQSDDLSVRLAEYLDAHRFGKYRGLVAEVGTRERLGQIRAHVPAVFTEDRLSPWARPSAPFAGPGHGFVTLPEVGDGVWIEFEAGDPAMPIWSGFWWGDDEIPEPAGPRTRVLATPNGHMLVLDDERGELRLTHGRGPSITITEHAITLQVGTKKIVVGKAAVSVNDGALEVS
jgi:uncharacterized protein involved in type VI secretion and phage assembly